MVVMVARGLTTTLEMPAPIPQMKKNLVNSRVPQVLSSSLPNIHKANMLKRMCQKSACRKMYVPNCHKAILLVTAAGISPKLVHKANVNACPPSIERTWMLPETTMIVLTAFGVPLPTLWAKVGRLPPIGYLDNYSFPGRINRPA